MRDQDLNLLPASARERVLRAQELSRSCRVAFALTVVAAIAAAGAEAGRLEAMEACDAAEARAETAQARDEYRRRLEAEVRTLVARAAEVRRGELTVPVPSILGAIGAALPADAALEWVRLADAGDGMKGEVAGRATAQSAGRFLEILGRTRPFAVGGLIERNDADGWFRASFEVPGDRVYSVVYGDSDVNAESGGTPAEGER